MKERENLHWKTDNAGVSCLNVTKVVIGWFKLQFECDWLIELSSNKLSDNKLSDNNLASELMENRSFLNQS